VRSGTTSPSRSRKRKLDGVTSGYSRASASTTSPIDRGGGPDRSSAGAGSTLLFYLDYKYRFTETDTIARWAGCRHGGGYAP